MKLLTKVKKGQFLIGCIKCQSVLLYEIKDVQKRPILHYSGRIIDQQKYVICCECQAELDTNNRLW